MCRTFGSDDFMRDYTDGRFWRFLLYLLVRRHEAQDWDSAGNRLGFQGVELLEDYAPQWHHIFPKKYMQAYEIAPEQLNTMANYAILAQSDNAELSDREPMAAYQALSPQERGYAEEQLFFRASPERLHQKAYDEFLDFRAKKLAAALNEYLGLGR